MRCAMLSLIFEFGPDMANILEYRLNAQIDRLPPLLAKCWRLIIRHMRTAKRGILQNEWYEIAPRIKRGERWRTC